MAESYDDFPRIEEAFQHRLDESLDPSGPDSLLDLFGEVLATSNVTEVVDVGCGEGDDAVEIAHRFGLEVVGVDPIERHLELSRAAAIEAGVGLTFVEGTAEALPMADASTDVIFAKESLMYADLDAAFAEFRRVLRPGGFGFVYQVFTGPQMADAEAPDYWSKNAGARSVRPDDMAEAIRSAGFNVTTRLDIGSEWGEFGQEQSGTPGRRLAHVARLRREPERYIAEFGQAAYDIMLHDCLWHVYRMLGLLHAAVFVFHVPPRVCPLQHERLAVPAEMVR